MATINVKILKILLLFTNVLLFITVQAHHLSLSGNQAKSVPTLHEEHPETNLMKLSKKEFDKSSKDEKKDSLRNGEIKVENGTAAMKLEGSSMDSKPVEIPTIPALKNEDTCLNKDCVTEQKPGNSFEQKSYDFDQRQNGSENYRIQIDGLVFVLAPADTFLLAGELGSELTGPGQLNLTSGLSQPGLTPGGNESLNISSKPQLRKTSRLRPVKPIFYAAPKLDDSPVSIKLINLIAPLLRQRRRL